MRPLRIVMIINSFRPLIGGGERQAERLAQALMERGHSVTVLTRWARREWPRQERLNGVRIVRVGGRNRWGYTAAMLAWIVRHRREIDVVHAHQSNSPLVVGALASKLWSLPVLCTPMTWQPELRWVKGGSLGIVRRWLFRGVGWIAKSDEIARALEGYAPGLVYRVPNGVDTTIYKPAERGIATIPVVVFVGRLEPPKRLDVLLSAWQQLAMPARLLVVGDGTLRLKLQEQTQKLGLIGVTFLGNREDVYEILREADIFVLPSEREGMPNVLLEAMSCGLACVASKVGAVPELLGGGAGVMVPPGEANALADALNNLLSNPAIRAEMGERARTRVLERYSLALVAERVEGVYYRAIQMGA